jgi:hypothetical protein
MAVLAVPRKSTNTLGKPRVAALTVWQHRGVCAELDRAQSMSNGWTSIVLSAFTFSRKTDTVFAETHTGASALGSLMAKMQRSAGKLVRASSA